MALNKPAIDYANARISELKQSYEIEPIDESELFQLLIEAHDDSRARKRLEDFIEKLKEKKQ